MKYFYIQLENPLKTWNKAKNVFKPLKRYFWFGLSANRPIFYYSIWGKILDIQSSDVLWKDKYNTPRYEECPYFIVTLFSTISFIWYWKYDKDKYQDDYWEQLLWYLFYYHNLSQEYNDVPDIGKAKKSWPWQDRNGKSTWNNDYLL